jgi:hypothetical protein
MDINTIIQYFEAANIALIVSKEEYHPEKVRLLVRHGQYKRLKKEHIFLYMPPVTCKLQVNDIDSKRKQLVLQTIEPDQYNIKNETDSYQESKEVIKCYLIGYDMNLPTLTITDLPRICYTVTDAHKALRPSSLKSSKENKEFVQYGELCFEKISSVEQHHVDQLVRNSSPYSRYKYKYNSCYNIKPGLNPTVEHIVESAYGKTVYVKGNICDHRKIHLSKWHKLSI